MKDVADGYATNYLIPRGFAVEATPAALRSVERRKEAIKAKAERERGDMRELAGRIEGVRLSFVLKAGAQGKVFGSVTTRDLAAALAARGIEIERAKIHVSDALKTLGTHRVEVRLLAEVRAELTVEITTA